MLYGFLGVGEGAFAHGREGVVGTLRYEGEHTLYHMALAAGRWTFEGDADRPRQQPRCHSEVQELSYFFFSGDARASQYSGEPLQDVRLLSQLMTPLPRLAERCFRRCLL